MGMTFIFNRKFILENKGFFNIFFSLKTLALFSALCIMAPCHWISGLVPDPCNSLSIAYLYVKNILFNFLVLEKTNNLNFFNSFVSFLFYDNFREFRFSSIS